MLLKLNCVNLNLGNKEKAVLQWTSNRPDKLIVYQICKISSINLICFFAWRTMSQSKLTQILFLFCIFSLHNAVQTTVCSYWELERD